MSDADLPRTVLPIEDRGYRGAFTYDAKDPDTSFPPIVPLRPPAGAPNVLIVLLDDVGFGATSTFGGPVNTPTFERLAAGGLRYTRFHTTALCSPTRAALLSGRNHHTVGMGCITELATPAPGYSSVRPNNCAPLPETLKLNGYATAHFGKCHEVPVWETSPAGPFDRWPTGNGFEYFYGFLGGETNQWYPDLVENTANIEAPATPEDGYHLMPDLADRAIALDPPAEGVDAGSAVLRVLRPGCDPRPAPRPGRVGRQVQGPVRPGLGPGPRGDVRPPEEARRHPQGLRPDGSPRGDPGVGRHGRHAEAVPRPPDGGVCRLPRVRRPPHRSRGRRHRVPRRARRHVDPLHRR